MVVEEHWRASGEAGEGQGDPGAGAVTGCFCPNLPHAKWLSFLMFVIVDIDVGRLKMDAPEKEIWDPVIEFSDMFRIVSSSGPLPDPTSMISNCSVFVKPASKEGTEAETVPGADTEEISLNDRERLLSGNLRELLVDMSCCLSSVACPDPET